MTRCLEGCSAQAHSAAGTADPAAAGALSGVDVAAVSGAVFVSLTMRDRQSTRPCYSHTGTDTAQT